MWPWLLLLTALSLSDAGPAMMHKNDTVLPIDTGLCRIMMDKFHELLKGMGLDDYMDYEKEYELRCDEHGNFEPRQCHEVAAGEIWCACVEVMSGKVRPNTMSKGEGLECDEHGKVSKPLCPPGWTQYGESGHERCYLFINFPKTWVEAESYCQFEGGHLASIDCEKTNHFLQSLSRGDTFDFPLSWAGATNAVKPCFWLWSDGETFEFEDFFMEQSKFVENSCLRFNFGCNSNKLKWSSGFCNETLPFVCAKDVNHN